MKDRKPTYPGRVKLVPVAGKENTYDMTMADQPTEAGTPLSKANLLKDETAAKFSLDGDATVDAALNKAADLINHKYITDALFSGTVSSSSSVVIDLGDVFDYDEIVVKLIFRQGVDYGAIYSGDGKNSYGHPSGTQIVEYNFPDSAYGYEAYAFIKFYDNFIESKIERLLSPYAYRKIFDINTTNINKITIDCYYDNNTSSRFDYYVYGIKKGRLVQGSAYLMNANPESGASEMDALNAKVDYLMMMSGAE